jgi:hypothetical protein
MYSYLIVTINFKTIKKELNMKKLAILSVAFFMLIQVRTLAQNVGINNDGSQPDNSAMLHVKSANKGLLIPQIALTGVNDATTIATPATSLLVYNTTDGSGLTPGYYYNSGTPASPVWKALISTAGLTNFTESNYSYDSRYGVKLLARNDAHTSVDFVISPKGGGGIFAQQPDGTKSGGNMRGVRAVDLQMFRGSATQVASGNYSFTIGALNTASGDYSIAAGYNNTAQSYGESVLGFYSTVGTGDANTYVATDRLFVVGNGTSDAARSNALTILKNANTTIGGSLTLNGNGSGTSYTFPIDSKRKCSNNRRHWRYKLDYSYIRHSY